MITTSIRIEEDLKARVAVAAERIGEIVQAVQILASSPLIGRLRELVIGRASRGSVELCRYCPTSTRCSCWRCDIGESRGMGDSVACECSSRRATPHRRLYFAQVSFNVVVRLNTGLPAAWSRRSATK